MTDNWQDNLPDELKNNASLTKFKTEADLANSYVELERRAGRSLTIPGDDATDEMWSDYYGKAQASGHLTVHPDHADDEHKTEFWKSLGVPEDETGYSVADDYEGLPKDYIENIRKVGNAAGWTQKQFKATVAEYERQYAEQGDIADAYKTEQQEAIKGKWGMAEESKKTAISAIVDKFQDPDNPVGELNAAAYLMMDNIVKALSGKGPQSHGQPVTGASQYTPTELDGMISDITNKLVKEGRQMGKQKYNALIQKKHGLQKMRSTTA